jgi:ketosteroid isomerase-like protein
VAEPGGLDVVRQAMRLSNEGDLEGLLELVHPEAVLDASRRVLNPGVYRGHDGYRQFLAEIEEIWSVLTVDVDELTEEGENILGIGVVRASGALSGVEITQASAALWTVRDGLIVRYVLGFETLDEARRFARGEP